MNQDNSVTKKESDYDKWIDDEEENEYYDGDDDEEEDY